MYIYVQFDFLLFFGGNVSWEQVLLGLANGTLNSIPDEFKQDINLILSGIELAQHVPPNLIKKINNPELIMVLLQKDGYFYNFISESFKKNVEMLLVAARSAIVEVPDCFRDDPNIMRKLIGINWRYFLNTSHECQTNRSLIVAALKKAQKESEQILNILPFEFESDPVIMLTAVVQDGCLLRYASEELKRDPNIVLAAVMQNPGALCYANVINLTIENYLLYHTIPGMTLSPIKKYSNERFQIFPTPTLVEWMDYRKSNKSTQLGNALLSLAQDLPFPIEFIFNQHFLLAAIRIYGVFDLFNKHDLMRHFTVEHRELILKLIPFEPTILKCMTDIELRNDQELILAVASHGSYALDSSYPYTKDFMLRIVNIAGEALWLAPDEFRNDPDIVSAAVLQDLAAINAAPSKYKLDVAFVLPMVQRDGGILWRVPKLNSNHTIVLAAVTQKGIALQNASDKLQDDETIVLPAVQQNGLALEYASYRLKNDLTIVLAAVRQCGLALQYASKELRSNPIVVLEAVKQNKAALRFALTITPEIANLALRKWSPDFEIHSQHTKEQRQRVVSALSLYAKSESQFSRLPIEVASQCLELAM